MHGEKSNATGQQHHDHVHLKTKRGRKEKKYPNKADLVSVSTPRNTADIGRLVSIKVKYNSHTASLEIVFLAVSNLIPVFFLFQNFFAREARRSI